MTTKLERFHSKRIGKPHYKKMANLFEKYYQKIVGKPVENVIDVGSSVGELLLHFSCPSLSKKGVDCDVAAGCEVVKRNMVYQHLDLEKTQKFSNSEQFQCITTLEVAEHIANWRNFLDFVQSKSGIGTVMFWTAAPPGQPGKSHVNCQTLEWWRKRLVKYRGWKFMKDETEQLKKEMGDDIPQHYRNNLAIFQRVK